MLLGHWGTTPGQNFICVHLNRVIKKYDLDMIYVSGPGHGGPAVVANTHLEGTYSEIYPNISQDEAGLQKLFKQFSFPGAFPATPRRNVPARSTKAANSVTPSAILLARYLIIPTSSSPVSSVMAKRKRVRWPRRYLEVQFHVGTAAVAAKLAMLEKVGMAPGERQLVQLRLAAPLPLVPGERLVIRANVAGSGGAGLTTIGGGRIVGLSNARLRRQKQWTIDFLTARREAVADSARWCEQILREGEMPVSVASLQGKCWSRVDEIASWLGQWCADGRSVQVDGGWIHHAIIQKSGPVVLAAVEKFHAADARRVGISREDLGAALKLHPVVLAAVIDSLLKSGQLAVAGGLLARPGWSAQLPEREQQAGLRLVARLQQAGFAPPSTEELAAALGETPARIGGLLKLLAERGEVVRLDDKIWLHRDAVEAGKQAALRLFRQRPLFSTMDFRDAIGVSRKYAVPLVDHLDKIRFTVRNGNNRTPGAEAKKLLTAM